MAQVVLFHHAQGLTPGVVAFADELRGAGHTVHTPDLFEGRTFSTIDEGMRHAEEIGFPGEVIRRGVQAVEGLPAGLVYAGFSLGVLPAQMLAQTRPGARGALLFYSCVPVSEFGSAWPDGVPVQVHGTTTRSSPARVTLTPPGSSSSRPRTGNCSCTPATSTISPTAHCRHTTRTPPLSWSGGCSTSSASGRRPPPGQSRHEHCRPDNHQAVLRRPILARRGSTQAARWRLPPFRAPDPAQRGRMVAEVDESGLLAATIRGLSRVRCRGPGRTPAPGSGGCCCPTGRGTRCRYRTAARSAGR
jgi:dienelactone hydrolase